MAWQPPWPADVATSSRTKGKRGLSGQSVARVKATQLVARRRPPLVDGESEQESSSQLRSCMAARIEARPLSFPLALCRLASTAKAASIVMLPLAFALFSLSSALSALSVLCPPSLCPPPLYLAFCSQLALLLALGLLSPYLWLLPLAPTSGLRCPLTSPNCTYMPIAPNCSYTPIAPNCYMPIAPSCSALLGPALLCSAPIALVAPVAPIQPSPIHPRTCHCPSRHS
ncbi:hypothetical protein CDD82_216 [Ophiocordyceps australis]|uniref:Uncharacterized protein n=1 Tax=Ophiocordyceps australis TaxID=1399860 RepID=A0A2C5YH99_9HYPO|nr:hypothetical protein CDD82_216 [Ophiocordyceps australis]